VVTPSLPPYLPPSPPPQTKIQVIDALLLCHAENPYAKFMGACNDQKVALDQCFRVRGCMYRSCMCDWTRCCVRRSVGVRYAWIATLVHH
jgi:hypothetical protein